MKTWGTALRLFVVLGLLTGVIYPLFITLVGSAFMPAQAEGSLATRAHAVVGSLLIAQTPFQVNTSGEIENLEAIEPYFWARPSAVNAMLSADPDTMASSSGSNLGPTSAVLQAQVQAREAAFRQANGLADNIVVPAEMLFASASGLDPHISPLAANLQVARIARVRGLPQDQIMRLVEDHTERPLLNFIGHSKVNVLALNLALDELEFGANQ